MGHVFHVQREGRGLERCQIQETHSWRACFFYLKGGVVWWWPQIWKTQQEGHVFLPIMSFVFEGRGRIRDATNTRNTLEGCVSCVWRKGSWRRKGVGNVPNMRNMSLEAYFSYLVCGGWIVLLIKWKISVGITKKKKNARYTLYSVWKSSLFVFSVYLWTVIAKPYN